jgi:hypothetical protein
MNTHPQYGDQITRVSGTSLLQNNAVVCSQLISIHLNTIPVSTQGKKCIFKFTNVKNNSTFSSHKGKEALQME